MKTVYRIFVILAVVLAAFAAVRAQTNAFTYQGRLTDASVAQPTNGTYNMRFALFGSLSGTDQIGAAITNSGVQVTNGVFTVTLNFTAVNAFDGAARYLEISVFNAVTNAYVRLDPRQPIMSSPYAIRTLSAAMADTAATATTATNATNATNAANADNLGGVAAGSYAQTNSTAFVRNQTTQQTAADFNISGTGAANVFNAGAQFNIGGFRVLSVPGTNNLFAGAGAGAINTGGAANSFVGALTGNRNSVGNNNSFLGTAAGAVNTGSNNSFVGYNTGSSNTTGSNNTLIGREANVASNNLSYATAIGAGAVVSANNTIALGRGDGSDRVRVFGGIIARGGAPGADGAGNNGYAFGDNGGGDSGMFSTADGTVQFYANNAERIRLARGINLTAGNSIPFGEAGGSITLQAGSSTGLSGAGGITLQAGNGAAGGGIGGASITLYPGSGPDITGENVNPGNVILAPTGGNVGIGTTNPTGKLHVNGDLTVTGGFVQLSLTTLAPPLTECDETAERGRMKVDATNNRLWICTAAGWKFAVLQ